MSSTLTEKHMSISRDSVEFLRATVEADADLETAGVALAIVADGVTPVWLPGVWVDDTGSTRVARTTALVTFDVATYPLSTYAVKVKLADVTEAPILEAYTLTITP